MYFLVSSRYQFVLGWSAKCACTTIKRWYSEIHDLGLDPRSIHEMIGYGDTSYSRVIKSHLPIEQYKKFILIRNPFERLASGFLDKYVALKQFPNPGWDSFFDFVQALCSKDPFGEAIMAPTRINKHHFVPQTAEQFSLASKSAWNWDLVLRVESLGEDIMQLNKLLGVTSYPGVVNKTAVRAEKECESDASRIDIARLSKPFPPYRCFYLDEALKKQVRQFYRSDFDYFLSLGIDYDV